MDEASSFLTEKLIYNRSFCIEIYNLSLKILDFRFWTLDFELGTRIAISFFIAKNLMLVPFMLL